MEIYLYFFYYITICKRLKHASLFVLCDLGQKLRYLRKKAKTSINFHIAICQEI
jgi:hypothetical protein